MRSGHGIGCRRSGVQLSAFADALAPGLVLAQAIGRWGNWFNQELFGGPTTLPWGLRIDPAHRPTDTPDIATYHPTFLYESLWCLAVFGLLIWADKRFASPAADSSPYTSPPTPQAGLASKHYASTTPTTSSAYA